MVGFVIGGKKIATGHLGQKDGQKALLIDHLYTDSLQSTQGEEEKMHAELKEEQGTSDTRFQEGIKSLRAENIEKK